jgi:hypothetical protein
LNVETEFNLRFDILERHRLVALRHLVALVERD